MTKIWFGCLKQTWFMIMKNKILYLLPLYCSLLFSLGKVEEYIENMLNSDNYYNNEDIKKLNNEFINSPNLNILNALSEVDGELAFEYFSDQLIRAEVISTADRCFFEKQGLRIDGYGGNPMDDDATLNLIVVDFCDQKDKVVPINRTEIDAINKRAVNFVSKSLNSSFLEELDITSEEFGLADLISKTWDQIQKIKIIFITNKSLNVRNKEFDPIPINGIYAEFISWDINRFYNLMLSGREKEDLVLKLSEYGGCITALNASSANNNFESYLCILSGDILANIFKKHSSQLLEQNVRVFLQAKGKVNKGIRNTIETEPNMFFSYNNGITATASHIEKEYNTKTEKGGMIITSITNFQIVNGGQTTASVHEALKRGFEKNLSDIQIQMKLSVISEQENAEKTIRASSVSSVKTDSELEKENAAFSDPDFKLGVSNKTKTELVSVMDPVLESLPEISNKLSDTNVAYQYLLNKI